MWRNIYDGHTEDEAESDGITRVSRADIAKTLRKMTFPWLGLPSIFCRYRLPPGTDTEYEWGKMGASVRIFGDN